MSRMAATTVAIGLDKGWTRRLRTTSPCKVTGTAVETTSHAAVAATTAHTKESAGLMGSRCQKKAHGSMPSIEQTFREQAGFRTPDVLDAGSESASDLVSESEPASGPKSAPYVAHLDAGEIQGSAASEFRVTVVTTRPKVGDDLGEVFIGGARSHRCLDIGA
jgi:hypothetical protein